jgi:ribose/xylose/arabinose/galactoside ABC-type transport system permease subunit
VNVALAVLGIEGSWQTLVYGVIILLALVVDTILKRLWDRAESRQKLQVTA